MSSPQRSLPVTSSSFAERRSHERVPVALGARLILNTSTGYRSFAGYVLDISEGGCQLRIYSEPEDKASGRLEVVLNGKPTTLHVITRWKRAGGRGWSVGVEFDRLTDEKQAAIRRLIRAHA